MGWRFGVRGCRSAYVRISYSSSLVRDRGALEPRSIFWLFWHLSPEGTRWLSELGGSVRSLGWSNGSEPVTWALAVKAPFQATRSPSSTPIARCLVHSSSRLRLYIQMTNLCFESHRYGEVTVTRDINASKFDSEHSICHLLVSQTFRLRAGFIQWPKFNIVVETYSACASNASLRSIRSCPSAGCSACHTTLPPRSRTRATANSMYNMYTVRLLPLCLCLSLLLFCGTR